MRILKKLTAAITAFALSVSVCHSAFGAVLSDHRGTDISGIPVGTHKMSSRVAQYNDIFKRAGNQYGIDPNILAAVCMQESGGINFSHREDGTPMPAWGIMQIEYTNEKNFAAFGKRTTGVEWTLEDRLDPEKAVPYAAYLLSEALYKYDCDYAKMLQAYNYGEGILNRILEAKGDDWMDERENAVDYVDNWPYKSYGDKEYVEHVFRYYYDTIEYIGAKVRINDKLIKFSDQYPIIIDGRTLIPIRAVSENMGAKVDWDGSRQCAVIKKDGKTIELYIGKNTAYVNGKAVDLGVPAQMINNRTLVPLRFVAEQLNVAVEWDGDTRTVEITY